MKIDNAILTDLLALADEIRQAERLTARQALKRAMREWAEFRAIGGTVDSVVSEPAALLLPGHGVAKVA